MGKSNKKEFTKSLKRLITSGVSEKGVIVIDGKTMAALRMSGYLKKVQHTAGSWYQMMIGTMKTEYALMEVKSGIFKVVLRADVKVLDQYHWYYCKGNVQTRIPVSNNNGIQTVCLERIILDLHKYGPGIIKDNSYDVHHMWFRCCAVESMLKSLDRQTHTDGHKITGNYSRSQCIRIENEDDFLHLLKQIVWADKLLKTRKFSIEF